MAITFVARILIVILFLTSMDIPASESLDGTVLGVYLLYHAGIFVVAAITASVRAQRTAHGPAPVAAVPAPPYVPGVPAQPTPPGYPAPPSVPAAPGYPAPPPPLAGRYSTPVSRRRAPTITARRGRSRARHERSAHRRLACTRLARVLNRCLALSHGEC